MLTKVDQLPDKTSLLLSKLPSLGVGFLGASDPRISQFAETEDKAFKLSQFNSKGEIVQIILVDPKNWTGFLWWKKPIQVQVSQQDLERVREGKSKFSPEVIQFLSNL